MAIWLGYFDGMVRAVCSMIRSHRIILHYSDVSSCAAAQSLRSLSSTFVGALKSTSDTAYVMHIHLGMSIGQPPIALPSYPMFSQPSLMFFASLHGRALLDDVFPYAYRVSPPKMHSGRCGR